MNVIGSMIQRAKALRTALDNGAIARHVLREHEEEILDEQRKQLFEGKASSGEDLRPYYSEDLQPAGYFRTPESAKRYAAWKGEINYPYKAHRNPDAPNLYINGTFHSEIGVQFLPDIILISHTTPFSQDVVAKYGVEQFGLMRERWAALMEKYKPEIFDEAINIFNNPN